MNKPRESRRTFLRSAVAGVPLIALAGGLPVATAVDPAVKKPGRVKLSCNLYSFNEPLMTGQMTLDQVLTFCADLGFDAVDPTAYYFPNYPTLPDDRYVYQIKRNAFRLGLDISGTGVRNDFTLPDSARRTEQVELVRQWIGVAARLGAPVIRVFAGVGKELPTGYNRAEVTNWVVLQNHADFIQTGDHVLEILRQVDSDWLAVNLDIGSFKTGDSYAQIAQVAPYAATWQIKENLFVNGREVETDLSRIIRIVRESGYTGYLPIETLGKGDPRVKVPKFYDKVRKALQVTG